MALMHGIVVEIVKEGTEGDQRVDDFRKGVVNELYWNGQKWSSESIKLYDDGEIAHKEFKVAQPTLPIPQGWRLRSQMIAEFRTRFKKPGLFNATEKGFVKA